MIAASFPSCISSSFVILISFFSGYSPPLTNTFSPTCLVIPIGISFPVPFTIPSSNPFASASYNTSLTYLSNHSGPRSSIALQTGRNADNLLNVTSTSLNPDVSSWMISAQSFPQAAFWYPLVFIIILVRPVTEVNWILDSNG